MVTLYTINNKLVKSGSKFFGTITEPTPPGPSDEVTIGTQIWKTKNLAIDDGGSGISTQTVNYGQGEVVEHYYTKAAADRVCKSIEGWHLPTQDEWNTLINGLGGGSIAGTKLKSTYGWSSGNGTDEYGFGVFPAGYYASGSISDLNVYARFWTATGISIRSYYTQFTSTSLSITRGGTSNGYSVRLIKDS